MTNLVQFKNRFLPAGTFIRRAYKELRKLSKDDYLLRPNRDIKKLIEEVWPLALVAQQLEVPSLGVCCKYLGESEDECDGELKLHGEWVEANVYSATYNIEITTAQFEKEHYLREALARYGSVFFDPSIHRIGSKVRGNDKIVSQATAQEGNQLISDSINWIRNAVTKKVEKNKPYPQPCILVVNLGLDRPLELSEWLAIVQAFPRDLAKNSFDFAFLVHVDVGEVHLIRLRS